MEYGHFECSFTRRAANTLVLGLDLKAGVPVPGRERSVMRVLKAGIRRMLRARGYEICFTFELDSLRRNQCTYVPPGHYFSPHPDLSLIRAKESSLFDPTRPVLDIDLREAEQLQLLHRIADIYPTIDFPERPADGSRYYYENPAYPYSDGIVLHAMLRLIRPQRLIEVGSGFSSAATLDTNERHFNHAIELTFIEPHPQLLMGLMTDEDRRRHRVIPSRLQDVDLSCFEALGPNDILFIDSTHVVKAESDVNLIFFEILPRLRSGVYIHFHDVFFPFEYPKEYVYEGRTWQELYLLRALLQNNVRYSIEYFQQLMFFRHFDFFKTRLPLCLKNGGANMWLKKR
jgi:hypothetical protein